MQNVILNEVELHDLLRYFPASFILEVYENYIKITLKKKETSTKKQQKSPRIPQKAFISFK